MFEQFSSGYYLGRLYVEPYDGEVPAIHRTDHERVNEELYADEGVTPLDAPLVMKLEQTHIPVLGDESVPSGTLAVPSSFADEGLPDDRDVLLAKRERAAELLRYSGYKFGDDAAVA
ncbi:DUF5802 family protein [Halopelagius fulvigenes]|uniref:DUF5802 family protein n=1 Tax=Halopelagius fulvigenes TaxID=1198324 RepID=A0ABD5TV35_9EURY